MLYSYICISGIQVSHSGKCIGLPPFWLSALLCHVGSNTSLARTSLFSLLWMNWIFVYSSQWAQVNCARLDLNYSTLLSGIANMSHSGGEFITSWTDRMFPRQTSSQLASFNWTFFTRCTPGQVNWGVGELPPHISTTQWSMNSNWKGKEPLGCTASCSDCSWIQLAHCWD